MTDRPGPFALLPADCEVCGTFAIAMIPKPGRPHDLEQLECWACGARCCEECCPGGRNTVCEGCEDEAE